MEKGDRFKLVVQRLNEVAPASSAEEARELVEAILNGVEDEYSGVPYDPQNHREDGRMYPPQDDAERKSPWVCARVFRTRGHYLTLAENGAIKITKVGKPIGAEDAEVVLDKPGKDGRRCPR